jgi:hypothetical protein
VGVNEPFFDVPEGGLFGLPADGSPTRQESVEVRWFRRGKLPEAMLEWFGADVADIEVREDVYLVATQLPNLSVKIRGGEQLDVKVFRGTLGDERVPGRARGWIDCWEKWTFPFASAVPQVRKRPGWTVVGKERRLRSFVLADGAAVPADRGGSGPECAVELTAVLLGGKTWWTLGFEATGSVESRRAVLDAAAVKMFEHPLPDGLRLQLTSSSSYAALLRKLPSGKRHLRAHAGRRSAPPQSGSLRPLSDASA